MSTPSDAGASAGRMGLIAIFALALALRLVAVGAYDRDHPQADRPLIDEAAYEDWALEIAGGNWLGDEIFFQEPLYPYALAVVYKAAGGEAEAGRRLARKVHALLGALTAVLVAMLGSRLFDRRAGLLAGGLWAVWGPGVWMSCLLLKPNLFLPLFAALAWVLAGMGAEPPRRRWLAVGVLAGLGALLRGNMLLLVPAFLVWPLARSWFTRGEAVWEPLAELRGCGLVLCGVALVLAPVALRNHAVGGKLVLSTSGAGTNVYGGNNRDNPYGIAKEFDWVRGVPAYEADDWRHEAERRSGHALDGAETSTFWLTETRRSLLENPGLHLRIFWNKLRLTLGSYEVPDNHYIAWDARWVPVLRYLPGFAHFGWIALAGLLLFSVRASGPSAGRRAGWAVAVLFALYVATIVLTVTSARVRLALVPLLLPFAGGLLGGLPRSVTEHPKRAAGALMVGLLAVAIPVLPGEKRAQDMDERDFNLASQLLDEGDLDGAEALLRALYAKHSSSARVVRRLSEVEYLRVVPAISAAGGDRDRLLELQSQIESILGRLETVAGSTNPRERFRAQVLMGAILQDQGQWGPATQAFEAARTFDPADRDLRRRLALCLAESAMQSSDPTERRAGLQGAVDLLEALASEGEDDGVAGLLAQIKSRLD